MDTKLALQTLPRLWCKPPADLPPGAVVFSRPVPELDTHVSFRSLDLGRDLDLIYDWVNQAYAERFWQLAGSRATIETIYRGVLDNPLVHSFIGWVGDAPVCQVDVYAVAADELAAHVPDFGPGDCGLHLLMCPPRQLQKGWSTYALRVFQEFYFSHAQARRLYAEPDHENHLACQLAAATGFRLLGTIALSYKTARLYCLHREDFRPA